ncbi:DUF4292 domain-containing protein [Sulfobacillus acidophilus]|uniref:DUF4292 domain-containing protein n=1 Tax=Sulfobacillus acidophilus TaxID=53633 RepID=A0ABS3AVQ0_9FIRM|nr:DUF4292 domain-containing protein [Sulfobacillus acidophilus]
MAGFFIKNLCFLFVIVTFCGCPKRAQLKIPKFITTKSIINNLKNQGAKRTQMSGVLLAKQRGLKAILPGTTIDVIVQKPSSFYFSIRSFFEQPMQVLTSDSKQIYALDLTDLKNPQLWSYGVEEMSFFNILPIPLEADEIVNIFLGIAPLENAEISQIYFDEYKHTYALLLTQEAGIVTKIVIDAANDTLLKLTKINAAGQVVYDITYSNFSEVKGINFAHKWFFHIANDKDEYDIILSAKNLSFNGKPLDDDVFKLEI